MFNILNIILEKKMKLIKLILKCDVLTFLITILVNNII